MTEDHDHQLHPDAEQLPGLVMFRFDAPLFFASAGAFGEALNGEGVSRAFAGLKEPVLQRIERYELIGPLSADFLYPTLEAALEQSGHRPAPADC